MGARKSTKKIRTWSQLKKDRFDGKPDEAIEYLNAVLEENGDVPALIVEAIKSVASAKCFSVEKIARLAGKPASTIHKALSDEGNPSLETLTSILKAMGLKLSVAVAS